MKKIIFFLLIFASLINTSLCAAEGVTASQELKIPATIKPSVIEVGGDKFTSVSGRAITKETTGGKVVTYTVAVDGQSYQGDDGTTITKNANGTWSDPSFDRAVAGGLPTSTGAGGSTVVIVSEKVVGADCICIAKEKSSDGKTCTGPVETRKYQCIVKPGLSGFQAILAEIVRTVVFVTMLLGVLAIVGLGIAWAWAGGDDVKMKSNLKHWGINTAIGLIILFLFRYILGFLAPWIFM